MATKQQKDAENLKKLTQERREIQSQINDGLRNQNNLTNQYATLLQAQFNTTKEVTDNIKDRVSVLNALAKSTDRTKTLDSRINDLQSKQKDIIKEKEINWIYTHWAGDTHQDHINTLNATMAAARLVKNVLCYEQVPLPRMTTTHPVANYYVDITDTIDFKLKGCNQHKSQIDKFKEHGFDMLDNVKTLAKFRGNQCGLKYAEAFNILKIVNV